MIFRTFIAPAFAAMTALQPAIATQQVPAGFQYINDSNEGDMYFIKKVAKSGNSSFVQMFHIDPNGETGMWVTEFNCASSQYRGGKNKQWQELVPDSVGTDWLKAACN